MGNFFTAILWLILCQIGLKEFRLQFREWIYIGEVVISYFGCCTFTAWWGLSAYIFWVLGLTVINFGKEIIRFLRDMKIGSL